MNISKASAATGLTPKTIRYYESIGLVSPADRRENGYRDYELLHIRELRFVSHARELGFSLEECGELLELYNNKARKSADVKSLAKKRIEDINRKIARLQAVETAWNSWQPVVTGITGLTARFWTPLQESSNLFSR